MRPIFMGLCPGSRTNFLRPSAFILQALKVHNWSCIGRLKRTRMPKLGGGGDKYGGGAGPGIMMVTAGRLLCDTYLSARELLKEVRASL